MENPVRDDLLVIHLTESESWCRNQIIVMFLFKTSFYFGSTHHHQPSPSTPSARLEEEAHVHVLQAASLDGLQFTWADTKVPVGVRGGWGWAVSCRMRLGFRDGFMMPVTSLSWFRAQESQDEGWIGSSWCPAGVMPARPTSTGPSNWRRSVGLCFSFLFLLSFCNKKTFPSWNIIGNVI